MGCFITNSKCDERLELAKIDTARKDLKTERKAFEAEKVEFKVKVEMEQEEFQRTIEKERGKLKRVVKEIDDQQHVKLQGEKKTALEVEAKQKGQNEALLKRERGLRKNESGLKLRFQKENEILTVREFDVQHREDQVSKDNKINSEDKDSIRDQYQSLLLREECVHRINAEIKGNMKDMLKRENALKKDKLVVEKVENAVTKRENAVEKCFAKLKKLDARMTVERAQMKQDSDSLFQRSEKLWQNKKELVKDQRHFDEQMRQGRKDMGREKDKLDTDKKKFREERESSDGKMRKDMKNLKITQNIVKILVKTLHS